MVLATYLGGTYECWPSNATVAENMSVSESTVERARTEAIKAGAIRSIRRRNTSAKTRFDTGWVASVLAQEPAVVTDREPSNQAQEPAVVTVREPSNQAQEPAVVTVREPAPVRDYQPSEQPRVDQPRGRKEGRKEGPSLPDFGPVDLSHRVADTTGLEAVADQLARWAGRDIGSAGRLAATRIAAEFNESPVVVGGEALSCGEFIRLAVDDAIANEKTYGTPNAASGYLCSVIVRCRGDECKPGEFPARAIDTRPSWKRERDAAREDKLAAVRAARRESKADAVRERRQRRADSMDWSGFLEADRTAPDAADALIRGETRLSTQTQHTPTSPAAQRAAEEAVTCTN